MLTCEALLLAEVNLAVRERRRSEAQPPPSLVGSTPGGPGAARAAGAGSPAIPEDYVVTLRQMAESTLGWPGAAGQGHL